MKIPAGLMKHLKLIVALIGIWLGVTSFHQLLPGKTSKQIFHNNQMQNRDAGALFYTESEEAIKLEYRMRTK